MNTQMLYHLDGANITPANIITIFLILLDLVVRLGMSPGKKAHPLVQRILGH